MNFSQWIKLQEDEIDQLERPIGGPSFIQNKEHDLIDCKHVSKIGDTPAILELIKKTGMECLDVSLITCIKRSDLKSVVAIVNYMEEENIPLNPKLKMNIIKFLSHIKELKPRFIFKNRDENDLMIMRELEKVWGNFTQEEKNEGLISASRSVNVPLAKFFISKGASNLDAALVISKNIQDVAQGYEKKIELESLLKDKEQLQKLNPDVKNPAQTAQQIASSLRNQGYRPNEIMDYFRKSGVKFAK